MERSRLVGILIRSFIVLFGISWIAIMTASSAGIPMFGFVLVIGSGLVVYALDAALTHKTEQRVQVKVAASRKKHP